MGIVMLLWALALLPIVAPETLNPQYVVVIPAIIHHPSQEKFCIHLSCLPETVHLAITLEMKIQNHTLVEKDVEKPGIFECISFQWLDVKPRQGIVDLSFLLASEVALGTYAIRLDEEEITDDKLGLFTVEEYGTPMASLSREN
ncbi:PREDICTED: alpha-2-macroglobulin-like [Gavialis gangeticus]|uniref:alpha-2-macroglobulin-like n=1 Tax=Gavialis gangeticus TaxID=94835 RepID=UPI00092ED96B|nr:PREDICTED: alpha-2-macroglobulin-like [Gavialis gangeticus]